MGFIAMRQDTPFINYGTRAWQTTYMKQNDIDFYTNKWVDTSQISLIDFSEHVNQYLVNASYQGVQLAADEGTIVDIYTSFIVQSKSYVKSTWSIQSLDLILGLVGGISSIIWSIFGMAISPYEAFKFQASLIGSIYPTSPQPDDDGQDEDGFDEIGSSKEAHKVLYTTVIERGKFYYNYGEYIWTWFLASVCCCCINKKSKWWRVREFKYNRYQKAVEQLQEEIDIQKHVSTQRLTTFLGKLILRKHQRALIQSFKKYQIDDMIAEDADKKRAESYLDILAQSENLLDGSPDGQDIFRDARHSFTIDPQHNAELTQDQIKLLVEIREKFEPKEIVADMCILYEVTNFKEALEDDDEFWEQYMDFDELGLVNKSKMDLRALDYDQRASYQVASNQPLSSNILSQ